MWPYCHFWYGKAGLLLAPCQGAWWVWGAPVARGAAWWGPWGKVSGERRPVTEGRQPEAEARPRAPVRARSAGEPPAPEQVPPARGTAPPGGGSPGSPHTGGGQTGGSQTEGGPGRH
ncbi:MAG TPA: hypothetical protein VD973_06315 [Symbiobacteriaceae bacterium]|nr:hypothetical protein [Symbiobacteriaceae bacterium]